MTEGAEHPVLLTGATGYIGRRLLPLLLRTSPVRCLVRDAARPLDPRAQAVIGDVLQPATLAAAMAGVRTAYYMVHMMAAARHFEQADREAARNFAAAASHAGVKRIIYLGALGDDNDPKLSPHIRSRHEVGRILRESGAEVIELRASIVIGKGSTSFELIRTLTHRLPVMICPRWLDTPTQPIAIDDALACLAAALELPASGSRVIEIGTPDVTSYGGLIKEYARQMGLRRLLIPVPVLTPWLSSLWLALVTPAKAAVGRHLIEGLRNAMVVRDPAPARALPVQPMTVQQAIAEAIAAE
ncbi:MAG: NAD(P)H-binding protein [Planctomycetes bacterium]|nr:NAD(P)H-binding protein [Planctomycetota bacterium]MCW8134386.1 NAD(P)H-binding protein [Planctomycetota bacterium]